MIKKQSFGSTGHMSSTIIFGAGALRGTQEVADKILDLLLKHGINHIDTAPSYGDSELRVGPWMGEHRDKFFLATKTYKRTYTEVKEELQSSLKRLQVNNVDMLQFHNLVDPDEWRTSMGDDGALKAAIEAKEQGLIRFIGVTGHGLMTPVMHKKSLERYDFDAVLLPWNYPLYQNRQYREDFLELVGICEDKGVAVQTIKAVARGPWGENANRIRRTWYEPLEAQKDLDLSVSWVIGQEGLFLNTAGDVNVLPKILDAAEKHKEKPSNSEMEKLVDSSNITPLFTS